MSGFVGTFFHFLTSIGKANCPQSAVVSGASVGRYQKIFWLLSVFFCITVGTLFAQPAAPTLNSPGSSSSPGTTISTLTPTMSWNASSGANNYGVYIYDVTTSTLVYNNDYVGNVTSLALPSGYLTAGHNYRWNMRASSSAGFSGYSSLLYFQEQTAVTVPNAPTLNSPGSSTSPGTTISTLTPTMSWNASSGANNYGVYITDVTTSTLVYNNDYVGNVTSLVLPSGYLTAGHSYRWNMRASNSAGFSGYSSLLYFQEQSVVTVPNAPTLISPGSSTSPGTTISTLTPTMSWNASSGANNYGVYVEDVTTSTLVYNNDYVGNVTSLTLPSGTLTAGHSYQWNMRASNSAGFSGYSSLLYFQEQGAVPNAPTLISPGSSSSPGTTISTLTPTMSWNASSGANNYGVYVEDVTTSTLVYNNDYVGNVTSLTLSSGTLTAGHSYQWNMRASNSTGFSGYSSLLYFQTTASLLSPPTQISPGSSTSPGPSLSTLTPTFSWNAVSGATGYGLYIRDMTASGTPLVYPNASGTTTTPLTGTSLVLPSGFLVNGHTYVWNMTTFNASGEGNASGANALYFQTAASLLSPPTQISPGSSTSPGPSLSTLTPTFSWNAVSGATGYGLYIRDKTASGTPLVYPNASGTTTTPLTGTSLVLPSGFLVNGHTYVWNMTTFNASGEGNASGANALYFQESSSSGPSLTVTSPNGGQNWTAGTAQTISWTVNGTPNPPINYFGMNYSLNGGTSWQTYGYFAAGSATSGTWSIPSTAASSQALIQIIAVNSSGVAMFWNQSASVFTISAPGQNPVANPTADNHAPQSGQQVNFTGTGSTDPTPGCSINSYLWNFGDGSPTSTSPNPSHVFSSPAGSSKSYTVSLQVSDTCGRNGTSSLYIYVTGQALGNNNSTQPTSLDPVNLATGNYIYNHVDFQIPGRGLPFEFQRYYNSKAAASALQPLGFGWTHSYNIGLSINSSNSAVIAFGDGHQETYATNGAGGYISEAGIYNGLTASGGTYTLITKEQQKYNFNSSGQLTSIVDKNNNTVSLAYTGIKLTTITNTVGRVISFAYNANNCLTNITDPLGRTVRFAYDANTNLISATDTRGGLTQFGYDQYHQITNAIDPRGNTFVSMVYDNQKRVVSSQKDALQNATTFTYDFVNNVTTVTDAMNNVSYNFYDNQLRVVRSVDNLGNQQFFQYDTNNNRTMVIDKNGAVTIYAYDGNGNVIAKTNSFVQTTTISYDALNNPTNRLDALTGRTVFRYDTKGNLTNTFNSIGKTNTYQYDAFGEPVVVTDANGNSTTNTYDSFGNLIQTRDALGDTNAFAYDAVSRKIKQVDALGHTNLFIYDNANNLTTNVNAFSKTSFYTFDGNNNRVSATDFNGYTTTSVYDPKDRLIIVRDPMGGSITNDYDALDRKIRVHDAMGGVTSYAYDVDGNLLAVTNAVGAVTRYAYDPNGNRTNSIDALSNSTKYIFDSLNRLVSTQDALGHTATSVYDALGRRIQGIDALNRTNFFAYDPMGRLTNFTDTAGGTVVNTYDNVGNRLFSTDPNGHTTTNVFDALNRLSKTTNPAGGVTQLGYDATGNLISRKDPNGTTTTYLYDANNRRTKITYPTGTPVTFGYDNNGNRTSMADALGTTTYSYDALNRLTSVNDCYGQTVSYGYDKNGNRTSITYPGGKTVTYAYDAANRLKSVTDWQYNTTTYNYDADGNLTSSVNPNGSTAVYQYDPANRLMTLTNTVNSTVISSYQYTLDAIGNHSQVSQTEQLPTIPVVGQSTYAYDNDSKQITLDGQTQVFDANGNMTSVNPTNLLAYDYENRLVQTSFTDATNTYQYDGAGNRMSANRSGIVTRYVLDRNSSLAQVIAETDSSGNVIYYYIYGLGLVSRIDAGGNAQYYHYDSRGSTIAMTDASGNITEAYAYDPFGRPINGQLSDNRFRYLGRHGVMDEENGLLYIRARYYTTKRGRFITKDPTTGKDGDSQSLNRYIYALNNPVNLIDISGLFSFSDLGVGALEIGQGLGQAELAGATAFFSGVEAGGFVLTGQFGAAGGAIASGLWSGADDFNESFRSLDAASANLVGAFRDQQYLLPGDVSEPFDFVFQSKVGKTISDLNTIYSIGQGLSGGVSQTISDLQDATTALNKYGNLLSPETLSLARIQLLHVATSLANYGFDLRDLNQIVASIGGSSGVSNLPLIPETIDPNAVASRPQPK